MTNVIARSLRPMAGSSYGSRTHLPCSGTRHGLLQHEVVPTGSIYPLGLSVSPTATCWRCDATQRPVPRTCPVARHSAPGRMSPCTAGMAPAGAVRGGGERARVGIWVGQPVTSGFTSLLSLPSSVRCLTLSADGEFLAPAMTPDNHHHPVSSRRSASYCRLTPRPWTAWPSRRMARRWPPAAATATSNCGTP